MNRTEALRILGLDEDATARRHQGGVQGDGADPAPRPLRHEQEAAGPRHRAVQEPPRGLRVPHQRQRRTRHDGAVRAGASADGGGSSARAGWTEEPLRRASPASPPPSTQLVAPARRRVRRAPQRRRSWPASAPWWPSSAAASRAPLRVLAAAGVTAVPCGASSRLVGRPAHHRRCSDDHIDELGGRAAAAWRKRAWRTWTDSALPTVRQAARRPSFRYRSSRSKAAKAVQTPEDSYSAETPPAADQRQHAVIPC